MNRHVARMFDLEVSRDPLSACAERAICWAREKSPAHIIACLNPHSAVIARRDPGFFEALAAADMLIPDGVGVVAASHLLRQPVAGRVTGSDVFNGVCRALNDEGDRSCFFLGSTASTLKLIEERMARDFPRLRVAGTFSPPFREHFSKEDDETMIAVINVARTDVLWVGMTAPKQEKWIHRNREKLDVPVIAAIGAVFDFFAGTAPRPNPILQRLDLEWAGRLLREPRRMWKRTFVSGPLFAAMVLKEMMLPRRTARR